MPVDVTPWLRGRGRIGRGPYCLWLLSLTAAGYLTHVIVVAFAEARILPIEYAGIVAISAELINAWLWSMVLTRRLHDIGRSGWWQLVPLALAVAVYAPSEPVWADSLGIDEIAAEVLFLTSGAIYLASLIALGIVRGAASDNRFGPPPVLKRPRRG